jgi:ribosomal protein S18 acetylase RimI-like enzyme
MNQPVVKIRPFASADVSAVIDIYNQARPIEVAQLTEDRFWSWFADPALDPTRDLLIAADDQGPVGIVASFPWPNHVAEGYVFFVGPSVLPEFQAHGVGRQLVTALLSQVARQHPGARLQTRLQQSNSKAHHFLTDGLGFSVERQFWQMSHAAPGKVLPGPPPEGYHFSFLRPGDDTEEVVTTYRTILNDPAAGRHLLNPQELQNWASLGNFANNSFQVARFNGQIVGLCFESFPASAEYGLVEFLGVLPEARGRGVATYLLKLALANAHTAGKRSVRLEVTDDGGPGLELYHKLGFAMTGGEVFYQRSVDLPVPTRL